MKPRGPTVKGPNCPWRSTIPKARQKTEHLMEEVCRRENLKGVEARACEQGEPGHRRHDRRRTCRDTCREHWPTIRDQLLEGNLSAATGEAGRIPKPDGGVRKLGIPTVVDRFIQQALLQVLQPAWDPTFSEHSYGFRPGRSAHQAVAQAQAISRKATATWWTSIWKSFSTGSTTTS